jgi:hypothetical protein
MAGHVAFMEGRRGACRSLVRKYERKNPPGRRMSSWEENIKIIPQKWDRAWAS